MSLPEAASPQQPDARASGIDLSTSVGTLHFSNPIIAASGTFGYGLEFAHLVDLDRLGGLVVKGLSLEPIAGAVSPRLCETFAGMMNAVGLQNIGVRAFIEEKLPLLRRYRCHVIANIFGHTIGQYAEVIRALEDAEGLAAYELNISCPNVERGGCEFNSDPETARSVIAAARKAAKRRPLWIKLAPSVGRIAEFAKAAQKGGADALTIANTYPAMSLEVSTRRSRLGNLTGGLSGPAIKPITVRLVFEASQAVSIPIIGLGGVRAAEDVLEYLLAGATAVQVGTAHFADPRASERLVGDLESLCGELNYPTIRGLIGNVRKDSA